MQYLEDMSEPKRYDGAFWMALIAMIVSVLALAVSVYEAQIMRSQQQIMVEEQHKSVWPYIQKINSVQTSSEEVAISLTIKNLGVGPALVNQAQLQLKDQVINSYNDAFNLISEQIGVENILGFSINHSYNSILAPGESVELFKLQCTPSTGKGWEFMPKVDICYCSIYDDCYHVANDQQKPRKLSDTCQ